MSIKKDTVIMLVSLVAIWVITGAVWVWLSSQKQVHEDTKKDNATLALKQKYTELPADHKLRELTTDELLKVLDKGDGILFLGFPKCPWCQKIAPILNEAAQKENVTVMYYDIRQARTDKNDTYHKVIEKLKDYLAKDEQGAPRLTVPDVTALRDGKIVGRFHQESDNGESSGPETYWTNERRGRAVTQFRELIKKTQQFAAIQEDVAAGGLLLDVRTEQEFNSGHIASATHFDIQRLQNGETPNVDKSAKIYLYCRSGSRSQQAKQLLESAGFVNVKSIGGLQDVQSMGGVLETNR